jgi:hypothetical protein
MLTKPAAAFAQILGAVLAFIGFGAALGGDGYWMLIAGAALLIWGGWEARNRIASDQAKRRNDPDARSDQMGFFTNLFGRNRRNEAAANLPGTGAYNLKVVGTSNYQSALEKICGGKTDEAQELEVRAILIHEEDNPHDKKAIRVDIDGRTVGYLSRNDAREYRKQLSDLGQPGITAACSAMIVGGWDDGDEDVGSYGVRLDLPTKD